MLQKATVLCTPLHLCQTSQMDTICHETVCLLEQFLGPHLQPKVLKLTVLYLKIRLIAGGESIGESIGIWQGYKLESIVSPTYRAFLR